MKQTFTLLLFTLLSIGAFAQQMPASPPSVLYTLSESNLRSVQVVDSCGVDTVRYVRNSKSTDFLGVTMNVPSEFAGYAQYYDAPEPITVHGIVFYAGVNSTNPVDTAVVTCGVWTANADSSMNMQLTSKDVTITNNYFPSNIDVMRYEVVFDSAITMSSPYHVSIQTATTQALGIISNDHIANDGGGEELGYWFWTGDSTWYKSGQFFAWDVDYLVEPIVTYDLTTNFCLDIDSACAPSTVCATASASEIFYSRMYNQNALMGSTSVDTSMMIDWMDGTMSTLPDTCHSYVVDGSFMPTLSAPMNAWTVACTGVAADTVYISAAPTAAMMPSASDLTVTFTNNSGGGVTSAMWDFGDANTSTDNDPVHTYASNGEYLVCLKVSNACGSDSICDTVQVCEAMAPNFTFSNNTGNDAAFTDGSTGDILSWSWDFGDSNTSTDQNPMHTYASNGTYVVCLTTTDLCGTETFCDTVEVIGVGYEEVEVEQFVTIYPNPAQEEVFLAFTRPMANVQLSILDAQGRLVYGQQFGDVGARLQRIALPELAAGSYYIQLNANEGQKTQLLLINQP